MTSSNDEDELVKQFADFLQRVMAGAEDEVISFRATGVED